MGTRARIGLKLDRTTDLTDVTPVRSIYSHWDGYPTGVGRTLLDHYSNVPKLTALLDEGDVSSLGPEIGEKHDFDTNRFDLPEEQQDWTLFYRRDRGEGEVDARVHPFGDWPDFGQEWEYLFQPFESLLDNEGGLWLVRSLYGDEFRTWTPLGAVIELETARIAAM